MNRNFSQAFLIFLFCLFSPVAHSQNPSIYTQKLETKPTHVTIYLQGATVTREAIVKPKLGPNEVAFILLSPFVDPNSLHVRTASGSVSISSVAFSPDPTRNLVQDPESIAQRRGYDSARDAVTDIQNRIYVAESEMQLLIVNRAVPADPGSVFVEDVDDMAAYQRKRNLELFQSLTILRRQLQEANFVLSRLGVNLPAERGISSGQVIIRFDAQSVVPVTFSLQYYLVSAGWTPEYSLRADGRSGPIALDYDAQIHQTSGETWRNVVLTLSSGNPSISQTAPNFYSLRAENEDNIYSPRPSIRGNRSEELVYYIDGVRTSSAPAGYEDVDENKKLAPPPEPTEYTPIPTQVNNGGVNTQFEISTPYSVPSTSQPTKVRIATHSVPVNFAYYTLPQTDLTAYLTGRITDYKTLNLVPGNASLYLDGAYVGKAYINPQAAKDTLVLSFGRDERINVTHELIANKDGDNKTSGKYKKDAYRYRITLRNNSPENINIKAEAPIPITSVADVEIEKLESSGASYDSPTGKLAWEVNLPSGASRAFDYGFTVRYPKGMDLTF